MMNGAASNGRLPGIIKYVQRDRIGMQSRHYSRHGVGYVLRGKKYIYYGDIRYEVKSGEIFYLKSGTQYTEEIPEDNRPYEEIIFFYTPENLSGMLTNLAALYNLEIFNDHLCDNCRDTDYVACPAWGMIRNFFVIVNQYIKDGIFLQDFTAEKMKLMELIYLVISNNECCIKCKILEIMDPDAGNFERTIQKHIFDDYSIEELARICNKSLTSFKKEFRLHFHESPHKWITLQRLMRSRLLLTSTNKAVSEIGAECKFPNTSHYIKLFKQEYGQTPAVYRTMSRAQAPEGHRHEAAPIGIL